MSDILARLMALAAMQSRADLSDYYTKAETDRHISDEVARIVSDAPEDFDTLRELSDWIATHEESAAAMNSAIQANTAGVAALYAEVATKAPQSTTYTKNEVDTALAAKLNTADVDDALDSTSANPVQNKAVQASVARLVDAGAKNLVKNTATSQTINGVTFTVNNDGTITANGTAIDNDATFMVSNQNFKNMAPEGTFFIGTGCPSGGSNGTYLIAFNYLYTDFGNGTGYRQYPENPPNTNVIIIVRKGCAVNNLIFKPMICTAEDHAISPEFVPYAPSNRELYEEKANYLKKTLVDSGNLDDISTDEFALYMTSVTGKPQNGYAFVRTSVFDSNAALQELTMLSGNSSGRAYVRVKYGGTWTDWRETTTQNAQNG